MSLRGYVKKTKPALWTTVPKAAKILDAERATKEAKKAASRRARHIYPYSDSLVAAYKAIVGAPVRPVSKKRQAASREYSKAAQEFVAQAIRDGKTCPVFDAYAQLPPEAKAFLRQPWDGKLRSTKLNEVHHTRGRIGALLLDKRHWIAVSKWGHRLIHVHQATARKFGWLCEQGQWNTPDPTPAMGVQNCTETAASLLAKIPEENS